MSPRRLRALFRRAAETSERHLTLGQLSYGAPAIRAYEGDTARVHVDSYVSIAEDVVFVVGGNHRLDWVSMFPFRARLRLPGAFEDGHPATKGDIMVGHDVWIGRGATILSGVKVGNGAVVAAASVVTNDVRPYAVVAGNPAREVKRRFTDDQVEALQRIAWWDWPLEQVLERVSELNGGGVEAFIARYSSAPAGGEG